MNITKLSKIADSKANGKKRTPASKKDVKTSFSIKDHFNVEEPKSKLLNRVQDASASARLLKKLKDDNTNLNAKFNALEKTYNEEHEVAKSVEEFFKPQLEEKEELITTLMKTIEELQVESHTEATYDILSENLKVDGKEFPCTPEIAKLVLEILQNIPNVKTASNYIIKDSLSLVQKSDLQEFVSAVETALEGNLEPLNDFDISGLPSEILELAKEIKLGQPYITKASYDKHVPGFKSLLHREKVSFPDLPLLADSKK